MIAPAFAISPVGWVTKGQKASIRPTKSFAIGLRRDIEEITGLTGGGSQEPKEFVMKRHFDGFLKNPSLRKHLRLFAASAAIAGYANGGYIHRKFPDLCHAIALRLEEQLAKPWHKMRLALEVSAPRARLRPCTP